MVMQEQIVRPITDIPTFSRSEMRKINNLIQQALLSSSIQERLLRSDSGLRVEFDIPHRVWQLLVTFNANSIEEWCGAIIELQEGDRS